MPLPARQPRTVRRAKIILFPAPPVPIIQAEKREIPEWVFWVALILLATLGEIVSSQSQVIGRYQHERQTIVHSFPHSGAK
jgi:hypothetical protein